MTELSGFHPRFVRSLARQGKIGEESNCRDWWIDVEVFATYLNTMLHCVGGRYEFPKLYGPTTVTVKIIDMLGEEVLATTEA